MQQKIIANLWFNGNAEQAVDYYISIFPNSKILSTSKYPESSEQGLTKFQENLAGKILTIEFTLNNQIFTAINAGPEFKFSEAISFAISCKDQQEIDYYWSKLSSMPESEQCGWCKDQFGLSWQIVPEYMEQLMNKPNAFANLMNMHKIVIKDF